MSCKSHGDGDSPLSSRMLTVGNRIGFTSELAGSIIVRPSTSKLYSYTPGSTGPTVTLQTPFESLFIGTTPIGHCPFSDTCAALGACRRNVTIWAGPTSGERRGAGFARVTVKVV